MTPNAERTAIVAWLRDKKNHNHPDWAYAAIFAKLIERGDHLKDNSHD